MKIRTYKVKGKLTRDSKTKEPLLILDEDNKQPWGDPEDVNMSNQEIPGKAADLARENDTQRTLAKGTLLKGQNEAEVTLYLKYLEG